MLSGPFPVAKSTLVAKLPLVIFPLVEVFLYTETVFVEELATAKSNFPSPSISPKDKSIITSNEKKNNFEDIISLIK